MSAQNVAFISSTDLHPVIEPIFIQHFRLTHGYTPALAELKQHLVYIGTDSLADYLRKQNGSLFRLYSKFELVQMIQLYIRKLY